MKFANFSTILTSAPRQERRHALLIINGYKEITDLPYDKLPFHLYFMWHAAGFPSILSHWHNRMEILYVIEGSLNVTCGSFSGTVWENELVIINPGQLHAAIAGKTGVRYYALTFESGFLGNGAADWCSEQYIQPVFSKAVQFQTRIRHQEIADSILDIAQEFFNRRLAYELGIKAAILRILQILYRGFQCDPDDTALPDNSFTQVLDYINENFTSTITTESLAEQFSFNKSYFCRKFKRQTGMSFVDYLTYRRLETASSLLRFTENWITEIYTEVGFNDSNYFSRKFFQCYGVRPTTLRESDRR